MLVSLWSCGGQGEMQDWSPMDTVKGCSAEWSKTEYGMKSIAGV